MAKKKKVRSGTPCMASYEGLCSRFTDMVGMKSVMPSAAWEMHVVGRTLSILQFEKPELLEAIRKSVRECYEKGGNKFPAHVDEDNGSTVRCKTCGKTR